MMSDFLYIFSFSISIICIFRCFYDIILSRNKFKNLKISISVKYDDESISEAWQMEKIIKHIGEKYLLNADVTYENIST